MLLSRNKLATLFLLSSLCALPSNSYALQNCAGLDSSGAKVAINKVMYEKHDDSKTVLTEKLEMEILLELKSRFGNLFPDTNPRPVLCKNREPKSDGSDFSANSVEALNDRDVLLELWGTIESDQADGNTRMGGKLYIMIIPVRHYEGSNSNLDFHLLLFPKKARGDIESASIAMLFGPEFDVYTSVAHGIKAMKNKSYDTAKKYLAGARLEWQRAREENLLARTATSGDLVTQYIEDLERNNLEQARADSAYTGDQSIIDAILQETRQ